jgi:hypothetical protein
LTKAEQGAAFLYIAPDDYEISGPKLTYAGMTFKRWERPKKEPEQKESQNEPQSEQK